MSLSGVELVGVRRPPECRTGSDAVDEVAQAGQILAMSENGDDPWPFGCGRVPSLADGPA